MAKPNEAFLPVLVRVESVQARMKAFVSTVLKKMQGYMVQLAKFIGKIVSVAKDIAQVAGKSAVNAIVKAGKMVMKLPGEITKLGKDALKMGAKIVATLAAAADPRKVVKAVKGLLQKFATLLNTILAKLKELMSHLDVLAPAFKALEAVKSLLQFMFSWIKEVSGINTLVKKLRQLLKTAMISFRDSLKEVSIASKQLAKSADLALAGA